MTDAEQASLVVAAYQDALLAGDKETARSHVGRQFLMLNGNQSTDPTDFQAHMFLTDDEIDQWLAAMMTEAGPHENRYEIVHTHVRENAAVVVTQDTGSNKFRTWEAELVTWLLGSIDGTWCITGTFIRDAANPESYAQ